MPVTKAICGHNIEKHAGAAGQGTAADMATAIIKAATKFIGVVKDVDESLKKYAAQPCPKDCPVKTPPKPAPEYTDFYFRVNFLPPKPPQRPRGEWSCVIGMQGKVEFDCGSVDLIAVGKRHGSCAIALVEREKGGEIASGCGRWTRREPARLVLRLMPRRTHYPWHNVISIERSHPYSKVRQAGRAVVALSPRRYAY